VRIKSLLECQAVLIFLNAYSVIHGYLFCKDNTNSVMTILQSMPRLILLHLIVVHFFKFAIDTPLQIGVSEGIKYSKNSFSLLKFLSVRV